MIPIEPSMSELPATELEAIKQRFEKARLYHLSYYMNATDIPRLFAEIERLRKLAELWGKERAELEAKLNIRGPFKAAQPQVYFFCEWAVYKKDAVSSICYTTSKEVADWIASRLNERDTLTAELDGWKETAAQFARNTEYYQGLLDKIGASLGPVAFVADDGSVMDTVLRAKIPELVEQLTAELASAKADTARLDWWDRERPLTHNELRTGHIVLAMEYGCAEGPTIRQAIDAALRQR